MIVPHDAQALGLEPLRVYLSFADALNFTHAARSLGLSQPAVHAQLRRLSEGLGLSLYARRGRSLELTDAGKQLVGYARTVLAEAEQLLQAMRHRSQSDAVTLAAGEGSLLYLLGPALRRFAKTTPYKLRLLTLRGPETLDAVLQGHAQLGVLVAGAAGLPPGLTAQTLLRVPCQVVVPQRHPLARKKSLRLRDLAGEALLLPPRPLPLRETLELAAHAQGLKLSVQHEAQGWQLLVELVGLGMGLSVVNGLVRLPKGLKGVVLRDLGAVEYSVVQRKAGSLSRAAQSLYELLWTHTKGEGLRRPSLG